MKSKLPKSRPSKSGLPVKSSPSKNFASVILPLVSLIVILAITYHKFRDNRAPGILASSAETAAQLKNAANEVASPATPPVKTVDVFYLAEGTASRPKSHPSSMRQPVITGNRQIANARAITSKEDGDFISPRWSPDGLELLFSKPGFAGLYTTGQNGGGVKQVTDREGVGFRAKWNREGQIETRSTSDEVQTFSSDGTPLDADAFAADSSLVGTFTKDDNVYLRSAPGEAPQAITNGDDRYYGGVLSPDGKYIAYNGLLTGLYIAPVDGSSPPVSVGEGYSPSWLPDGSGLVYNISQDDGHLVVGSDLYHTSVDGNSVSNLTNTSSQSEMNPTVSPDGALVAFEDNGVIYIGQLN